MATSVSCRGIALMSSTSSAPCRPSTQPSLSPIGGSIRRHQILLPRISWAKSGHDNGRVVFRPGHALEHWVTDQQSGITRGLRFGLLNDPANIDNDEAATLALGGSGTVGRTGLFAAARTAGSAMVKASASGLAGTATVSVATSSVLFSDNFTAGAGNWTVTSGYGDYYLANVNGNNRLMVYNDGFDVSRIVAGQSSWTNYSYQATLEIDAISTGSASLLARVQDTTHLYFFGYNVALGEWMIAMRNGPTVTILATSAAFNLQADQDYTVRADLSGNSLKLYVSGVLQVSTTDSTYTSGKIGFSATSALALLDDVVVTTLPAPAKAARPASAFAGYDAAFASLFNQTNPWRRWRS